MSLSEIAPLILVVAIPLGLYYLRIFLAIVLVRTRPIAEIRGGFCEIKASLSNGNKAVKSPMAKTPCVYYELKVREARGKSRRTIVHDKRHALLQVEDGSGTAVVHTKDAKLVLTIDTHRSSGLLKKATPDLERLLRRYSKKGKVLGMSRSLSYRETVLEKGDELYVLGPAKVEKDRLVFQSGFLYPLIVSDKHQFVLMLRYGVFTLICGGLVYYFGLLI